MVEYNFSLPFGRIFFGSLFPGIILCKSKAEFFCSPWLGEKCRKRRTIWGEDELIVASGHCHLSVDWHLKVLKGEPKVSDHYHYHGYSKMAGCQPTTRPRTPPEIFPA